LDAIEKLLAIEEIKQLKARYFRMMDRKDWQGMRQLFVDDVLIDMSEAYTPLDHSGQRIELGEKYPEPNPKDLSTGADSFVDMLREVIGGVSTVHHGHTPEIEILSKTRAEGIWAMEDKLRWPNELADGAGMPEGAAQLRAMHGYGHYWEEYHKVEGKWLIARLKLTRVCIDNEFA